MTRFKLRYRAIDLDVGEGEFVVGRQPDCSLALDDALVSRRHALFRVVEGRLEVQDLGSRNGVFVNGDRIHGRVRLNAGDRTRIGSQELIVKQTSKRRAAPSKRKAQLARTMELGVCPSCSLAVTPSSDRCPRCDAELGRASASSANPPSDIGDSTGDSTGDLYSMSDEATEVEEADPLMLLANIAGKALTMGRYHDAERILGTWFETALNQLQRQEPLEDDELSQLADYAVRVAEAAARPQLLDPVFRLYAEAEKLMPADTVDSLYGIVYAVRYSNPVPLRDYLAKLHKMEHDFTPSQRFLLRRLEGLEGLVMRK